MAMATTILRTMLLKIVRCLVVHRGPMIATRSVSLVLRSQNRGVSPRARYCGASTRCLARGLFVTAVDVAFDHLG